MQPTSARPSRWAAPASPGPSSGRRCSPAAPAVAAGKQGAGKQGAGKQSGGKQGAGKPGKGGEDAKGKFRETMWFKKGELDAQAAQAAAEEQATTGNDAVSDRADSLPIDE